MGNWHRAINRPVSWLSHISLSHNVQKSFVGMSSGPLFPVVWDKTFLGNYIFDHFATTTTSPLPKQSAQYLRSRQRKCATSTRRHTSSEALVDSRVTYLFNNSRYGHEVGRENIYFSPVSTFPPHLVPLLIEMIRYPNVIQDKHSQIRHNGSMKGNRYA